MVVGILFDSAVPTSGGTASLLTTISKELYRRAAKENVLQFVICYYGNGQCFREIRNGYVHYDLTAARKRYFWKNAWKSFICLIKNSRSQTHSGDRHFSNASVLDCLAHEEQIDVYWFTSAILERVSKPYIFTIWDLGHRILPMLPEVSDCINAWKRRENTYQSMIAHASYIITANQTGKKEILDNYSVSEDKIRIVDFPLASLVYEKEEKPRIELADEYFMYPAQFWSHKNHIRILEALDVMRRKYNKRPVVYFIGSDAGNLKFIQQRTKELDLEEQVVFLGFIKNSELVYIYKHAKGMIYASLMGPNNMPPYEAVYFGCPVIISSISGHHEQMGDAAFFFDPYNADELAEQMFCVLENAEYTNGILKNAQILKSRISEKNYVKDVASVFNELRSQIQTYKRV